jgi:phosphoribosylformylglycinamidine cyclo-ligase
LPDGVRARVDTMKFPKNPIFDMLAKKGNIPARDMYNTFNMGIGLILAVSEDKADAVTAELKRRGESPVLIGTAGHGEKGIDLIW